MEGERERKRQIVRERDRGCGNLCDGYEGCEVSVNVCACLWPGVSGKRLTSSQSNPTFSGSFVLILGWLEQCGDLQGTALARAGNCDGARKRGGQGA